MGGYRNFKEMKQKKEELSRQREFLGEEIQRSFLSLGKKPDSSWYKNVENWFLAGDVAYEIFKRFKR